MCTALESYSQPRAMLTPTQRRTSSERIASVQKMCRCCADVEFYFDMPRKHVDESDDEE